MRVTGKPQQRPITPSQTFVTAWYGNCTARNRRALQRVVRSVQRITEGKLHAFQDTYSTRRQRKAKKIIKNINHPSHGLFPPLSSRKRVNTGASKLGLRN